MKLLYFISNMTDPDNEYIMQMHPHFDEKEAKACYDYILSGGFLTEFKNTRQFEKMICEYTGAKHCFAVNNGTVSLVAALLAVGVGVGDEVIVPDFTMIATPNAVKLIGAIPVFVDIDPKTLDLDLEKVKDAMTSKTKAVMHVSLNARCGDIEGLKTLCDENNIKLIEDSAQSLGSFHNGKHLGTFGDIGSFSFSPPKIISTGQGGALITNDDELANNIKRIKDFGRMKGGHDNHDYFGVNLKFTDVQAVIGIEQMKKLPQRVRRIKEIWNLYREKLKDVEQIQWIEEPEDGWIPWFVDIYIDDVKGLQDYLKENNIGSRTVYPPIHSQPIYAENASALNSTSFPVTDKFTSRGLWLPSSTALTNQQIDRICNCIRSFYKK
jgi:perosamine synthetase